ncbi:hypothetical protein [uncultured Kordia sp.]|uniref:hypothetical protein n=1 Tax=uncultured Kordia sp. TaxID=507699 RepID=UPI00260BD16C|nr:hypothetical protein [uncultured Kordia sp.]
MNNRFLPIKVANKELSINLSIDPKSWYDPAFVVVNSNHKLLLSIPEKTSIIPEHTSKAALNPRVLNEKLVEVDTVPVWEVTIGLGDYGEDEQGEIGTYFTGETNNSKKQGLKLNFTGNSIRTLSDWGAIHVHFHYKEAGEEVRFGSCYLIVSKEENKFGSLNIDLGSEATQMAYLPIEKHSPGISPVATNISIINEIKKGYAQLHVGDHKTDYIQRDKTDEDLYKTGKIIYKRKGTLSSSYDDPSCVMALLSDRSFLDPTRIANYNKANNPMLWDWKTHESTYTGTANVFNEKEAYIEKIQDNLTMIGNLKLAYLDPSAATNIELDGKGMTGGTKSEDNLVELISYIYQILIGIGTREMKKGKNALFMRLLLLMPNVYDQDRVNNILRSLNKKFNKEFIAHFFTDRDATRTLETPIVIEAFAISESDASLIGYLRNNSLRVNNKREDIDINDRFLIIDAGRGTIDYSILEFQGSESYTCIDRGGMAGAGQYLTNIFLKAVGSLFSEKYGSPEKYSAFIQRVDMVQALVLEEFYERLKMNYSIEYHKNIEEAPFFQQFLKHIDNADDRLAIEVLRNSFDQLDKDNAWVFTVERPKDFIEAQSLNLVETLVENLVEGNQGAFLTGIKYIVLSGRGMKFDLFRSQLQATLEKRVKYTSIKNWLGKVKDHKSVIFPDFMSSKDLKKKAVNLKRITNFSVNSNSNLLITFDNESENNSLFSGVAIEENQLRRFNYSYSPSRSQNRDHSDDEITSIYYLGMQSDFAFLLGSNAKMYYPAQAERNNDYRNFLNDTLFGPGQSMKANPDMYNRFIKEISYLGINKTITKPKEEVSITPDIPKKEEKETTESFLATPKKESTDTNNKKSSSDLLGD